MIQEGIPYTPAIAASPVTSVLWLIPAAPVVASGIIALLKQFGLEIMLAAPTGRAAKRMSETCGFEAKTIHRLLGYKPPNGYEHDGENPFSGDVLIGRKM